MRLININIPRVSKHLLGLLILKISTGAFYPDFTVCSYISFINLLYFTAKKYSVVVTFLNCASLVTLYIIVLTPFFAMKFDS